MIWKLLFTIFMVASIVDITEVRAETCRRNQFKCNNGECIRYIGKCDGQFDCSDGSDEERCSNPPPISGDCFLPPYPEDGTYQVDGDPTAYPGIKLRAAVLRVFCDPGYAVAEKSNLVKCFRGRWYNRMPQCIPSNETIPCRDDQWQCNDGYCIDIEEKCNGIDNCPLASDETYWTCNNVRKGGCALPDYPPNGVYEVEGDPYGVPGKRYRTATLLTVSCDPGYAINGYNQSFCFKSGFPQMPKCTRYCTLEKLRGIDYSCVTQVGDTQSRSPCSDKVFVGTTVEPTCEGPNYYGDLSHMHCMEGGQWSYIPKCTPECGRLTPKGQPNIINGTRARHGDLPWHAGIYRKTSKPYMQICGGSLINTKAVISAAHCFWQDGLGKLPPENYAVALGKIYRPWSDPHDEETQRSDVSEIHIPTEYRGSRINYQYDLAVLILVTEIVYKTFVRPVCINFDETFNAAQLQDGNLGKVAGWGLTGIDGKHSPVLKVVDLPYVSFDVCYEESPDDFREYITADKFCAGYTNGTALCEGDSGGGLAFPSTEHETQRYYLRGVVSTAPGSDVHACNPNVRSTFTRILTHKRFIKNYVTLE